ncbi:MAG: hypothetical protein ACRERC_17675 [Candidatus Binatia bacterium]
MRRVFFQAMLLFVAVFMPATVRAGWVVEWANTAVKSNGDKMPAQSASMTIAGGKVRNTQPEVVTMIDYNTGHFTLMNSTKQYFWTGTVDEYVTEMTRDRSAAFKEKLGAMKLEQPNKGDAKADAADEAAAPAKPRGVDKAKLPPLSITKTEQTAKIAGHDTTKYEVRVDGDLFQEIWIAPLNVAADLDLDRYLTEQRKMSATMLGKSSGAFNALYLSDDYRKLLEQTFVLKTITHHLAGSFERVATSIQQAEVPPDTFVIPDEYRRVRLADVLPAAPPQPAPDTKPGTMPQAKPRAGKSS